MDESSLTSKQRKALESIRKNPANFKRYKAENQFEELALEAVRLDGDNYDYVSPQLITDQFIDKAIDVNCNVMSYLYSSQRTKERCLRALKRTTRAFVYMPQEYRTEELIKDVLTRDGMKLEKVKEPTEEMKWLALKNKSQSIQFIDNPTEEMILYAVKDNGLNIRHIDNPSKEVCLEAVKNVNYAKHAERKIYSFGILHLIKEQTEEICLESVKRCGLSLKHAQFKTKEICMEAIKNDIKAIIYVSEMTEDLQLIAIEKDPKIIETFHDPSEKVCLRAIEKDWGVIQYIEKQTPELCMIALEQNPEAEKYFNL